jgi:hypothetical protein
MTPSSITRQDLERQRLRLGDLQRQLASHEQQYARLHQRMQAFVDRYIAALGPLYLELDALESQLHSTVSGLAQALRHSGIAVGSPKSPRATELPRLPLLPAGAPMPAEPPAGVIELPPPTLKTLYRRAAMRLHPDLAPHERERRRREQQMMSVNEAYASGDRGRLEKLLLADGEDPVKVTGGNADALSTWLSCCEQAVRGRLRVVQAHLLLLDAHPMHQLWQAIAGAEARSLDPLAVMASRLRSQIAERRRELYIGQRLQPDSGLAAAFLRRSVERMGGAAGAH